MRVDRYVEILDRYELSKLTFSKVEPFSILKLSAKNIKICRPQLFNYLVTRDELEEASNAVFDFMQKEHVSVDVYKVYPLKDVAQAHEDLESRKTTGKLLLKP
jgi:NADPH:quinone reductase